MVILSNRQMEKNSRKDGRIKIMSKKKAGLSANAKWGIAFLVEIVVMVIMVVGYVFFYANMKLDNI